MDFVRPAKTLLPVPKLGWETPLSILVPKLYLGTPLAAKLGLAWRRPPAKLGFSAVPKLSLGTRKGKIMESVELVERFIISWT